MRIKDVPASVVRGSSEGSATIKLTKRVTDGRGVLLLEPAIQIELLGVGAFTASRAYWHEIIDKTFNLPGGT